MNITEKDLLAMKSKIDDAKSQISTLKGKLQYVNQQLLDEWECTSPEEAQKTLKKMEGEIKTISSSIEKGMEELNEKYGEYLNG